MDKTVDAVEATPQEVVLVISIEGLLDREAFEKQLKRGGFSPIPDEPFSYIAETTTHKINTILHIHSTLKRAITQGGFTSCRVILQIGEYPMEGYRYDTQSEAFVGVDI
jgi:hypothetical protein